MFTLRVSQPGWSRTPSNLDGSHTGKLASVTLPEVAEVDALWNDAAETEIHPSCPGLCALTGRS